MYKMKYSTILSFIISLTPFILGFLYILLRYYVKTDYKMTVDKEIVFFTLIILSFFWWYVVEPYLDKRFY
jgi:hypothetical protein